MSTNEVANKILNAKGIAGDGSAAIPFMGCICFFSACYTEWPQCFGCAGTHSCLCSHTNYIAWKIPTEDADKIFWFICARGQSVFADIKNCCSTTEQFFCYDFRGSIPPTDDIPCMVTFCFFTFMFKNKFVCLFFKPLSELDATAASIA